MPDSPTNNALLQMIYDEVKELREDSKAVGERLTRIETNVTTIIGNGKPGRLDNVEDKVSSHSDLVSKFKGAVWVLGLLTTGMGGALLKLWADVSTKVAPVHVP